MDFSALDDLDLPVVAPGEVAPVRRADHAVACYDPWGAPITAGKFPEMWRVVAGFKRDERNRFHTSMWWHDVPLEVSTVYLGLDHQFGDGPPLVWETMIFTDLDWLDQWCRRYATRTAAQLNHRKVVECLQTLGVSLHLGGQALM